MGTSYSPDCEYVDGLIVQRNVGKRKHSLTQTQLAAALMKVLEQTPWIALVEQRVRITETRVRIPDLCVVSRHDEEEIVTKPPLLCVEVLSPDDRWKRVSASVGDYLEMGVACVWVVDPYSRRAWIYDEEHPPVEVHDNALRAAKLAVELELASLLPPE